MATTDRVLVACPVYRGKAYALEAYLAAFNDFLFPNRGLYLVDNSGDGLRYFEHLRALKLDCDHIQPSAQWQETFARCWKKIAKKAAADKYEWVASIEADNLCPPLTLDCLLNIAGYCRAVHVAHAYPWHTGQSLTAKLIGLGCNLIKTELLTQLFAREAWLTDAFESEIYEYPKVEGMPTVEVYNILDIKHMDSPPGHELYIFDRDNLPLFTKGRTSDGRPYVYKNAPPPFDLNGSVNGNR